MIVPFVATRFNRHHILYMELILIVIVKLDIEVCTEVVRTTNNFEKRSFRIDTEKALQLINIHASFDAGICHVII